MSKQCPKQRSDCPQIKTKTPKRLSIEDIEMKKRWMKSVIEASKTEATVLPFQRSARCDKKRCDGCQRKTA